MQEQETKIKDLIDYYIRDKYLIFTNFKNDYTVITVKHKENLFNLLVKLIEDRYEPSNKINVSGNSCGGDAISFDIGTDVYYLINYDDGTIEC